MRDQVSHSYRTAGKILVLYTLDLCLCNRLHVEELHNLYSSPDRIRMTKSWRMKWAGHVAQMKEKRNALYIGGKGRRKETTRKTRK
jgi:hypothetical protein